MAAAGLCAATFAVAFLSGFVPLVNLETYLLSVAALRPGSSLPPVVLAASLGQMSAKCLLFLAGRGALALPLRHRGRALQAAAWLERRGCGPALVFASAFSGIPPFYLVSVAAGLLRFPLAAFLLCGTAGRLLRFSAVFLLPRALEVVLP